jgi:AcrR family transcriptional regulator
VLIDSYTCPMSADWAADGKSGAPDQRQRILQIAAQLFAKNGYHATGVAELGKAVSLGRGGLYHHIGSKEKLLEEISIRHVVDMVQTGEDVLASDASPPEKFRTLSRKLMRTIAENLPEVTVFFREVNSLTGESREHVMGLRARFEEIWVELLREGVGQSVFRTADPLVAKALLGLHNYSYVWLDPDGRLDPEEIADLFCDLLLRGLLTETALQAYIGER